MFFNSLPENDTFEYWQRFTMSLRLNFFPKDASIFCWKSLLFAFIVIASLASFIKSWGKALCLGKCSYNSRVTISLWVSLNRNTSKLWLSWESLRKTSNGHQQWKDLVWRFLVASWFLGLPLNLQTYWSNCYFKSKLVATIRLGILFLAASKVLALFFTIWAWCKFSCCNILASTGFKELNFWPTVNIGEI